MTSNELNSRGLFSRGRVLLVDDEPLVLEMFESLLSQEGYDVFVAPNAKDALNHIEKSFFDILVCDVRLDDLNGFDIMEIARKRSPSLGVVLITGAPNNEDADLAKNQQADYLSKPVPFNKLIESVANCQPEIQQRRVASA